MRNGKAWIGLLLVAVVGGIALGTARYFRGQRGTAYCSYCLRPVHASTRAVAARGDKPEPACCPACVLAMRAQTGKKVRLVSVADFDTHRELAPAQAAYVVGSDVPTCAEQPSVKVDETKHPLPAHYDRCAPSIVAFGTRQRAEEFARKQGGKVATLEELGMR